jgi:hypothetical protein
MALLFVLLIARIRKFPLVVRLTVRTIIMRMNFVGNERVLHFDIPIDYRYQFMPFSRPKIGAPGLRWPSHGECTDMLSKNFQSARTYGSDREGAGQERTNTLYSAGAGWEFPMYSYRRVQLYSVWSKSGRRWHMNSFGTKKTKQWSNDIGIWPSDINLAVSVPYLFIGFPISGCAVLAFIHASYSALCRAAWIRLLVIMRSFPDLRPRSLICFSRIRTHFRFHSRQEIMKLL